MLTIVMGVKASRGNLDSVDGDLNVLCNVCLNCKIETITIPCGHKLLCRKCMEMIKGNATVCFMCLNEITGFEMIR